MRKELLPWISPWEVGKCSCPLPDAQEEHFLGCRDCSKRTERQRRSILCSPVHWQFSRFKPLSAAFQERRISSKQDTTQARNYTSYRWWGEQETEIMTTAKPNHLEKHHQDPRQVTDQALLPQYKMWQLESYQEKCFKCFSHKQSRNMESLTLDPCRYWGCALGCLSLWNSWEKANTVRTNL